MFGAPNFPYMQNGYPPFTQFQYPQPSPSLPVQSPYQQPQEMPQQPAPQGMDWIRVNNLEDVKNVSVQPGQKAWIMLQNDPVFVVKSANEMGLATVQAFKFEPYNPQETPQPQYATVDDLNALRQEIEKMKGVNNDGKSIKPNSRTSTSSNE